MSWIEASNGPHRLFAVHPSGNDPDEWRRSGHQAADDLLANRHFPALKSNEPIRVLEYGCGPGRILWPLSAKPGIEAHGVDIAESYIKDCKSKGLNATAIDPSERTAHFQQQMRSKFDVVFSLTVFIHLFKKDARVAMQYCYDALAPGGVALLQIPIYNKSRDPESWTHIGCFSKSELMKMANEVGFQAVELFVNNRDFNYNDIGPYHSHYQVFRKPIVNRVD